MSITISINNAYSQINGLSDMKVIEKLDRKLSYFVVGYNFTTMYKLHKWDGKKHLINNKLQFQTGLLPYIEETLKKENVEYELKDNRLDPVLGIEIPLNPDYYTPRDYQIAAVDACLKNKCGIVKAATGSGKTLMISMLLAKTNIKSVVYVISLDLLYQTKQAIEDALGIECGIVGDGRCDIRQITIATPWTINRAYDKTYDPFDDEEAKVKNEQLDESSKAQICRMVESAELFVFDESQYLAAESCQLVAKHSKNARYRIAMSGTPWRDDGADQLLEAATGKQLIDIDATTLIEKGILVPPKIYFFQVPELPGYKKWDNHPYQKVYDAYIAENKKRNEMIIDSASKLFEKGRKTLMLVKRKKHGLKLLEMMPAHIRTYYLDGDAKSEERIAAKQLFAMGGLDVIIASVIFDAGIDLPLLDALILAGGGKSSTRSLQRVGRVIRGSPNKTDAIVVDLIDTAPYLYEPSKKRHAMYKRERAFQIKLPDDFEW